MPRGLSVRPVHFERYATTVAAFIRLAMIRIMLGDLLQTPRHELKLPGWAFRRRANFLLHSTRSCGVMIPESLPKMAPHSLSPLELFKRSRLDHEPDGDGEFQP